MKKFVLANNYGKGFITYDDQERDDLSFKCLPGNIVEVIGNENKINLWMERVSGLEMKESEAIVIVEAKKKASKLEKIKELKAELVKLEKDVQ